MAVSQLQTGPTVNQDGAQPSQRGSRDGSAVVTDSHGRLYEASSRGNLFAAQAIVTAPVIFSTAAGTGGPLLWNGSPNKVLSLLKAGFAVTTASTVAGALGLTMGTGQTSAPTSTTAIDGTRNLLLGGPGSAATAYRVGTVANAGNILIPFAEVHTGAVTVDTGLMSWVDFEGMITIPPGGWVAIAGSATLTTLVAQLALIWEELPF